MHRSKLNIRISPFCFSFVASAGVIALLPIVVVRDETTLETSLQILAHAYFFKTWLGLTPYWMFFLHILIASITAVPIAFLFHHYSPDDKTEVKWGLANIFFLAPILAIATIFVRAFEIPHSVLAFLIIPAMCNFFLILLVRESKGIASRSLGKSKGTQ